MRLPSRFREMRLRHHATLSEAGRFTELVSVSVGPSGEAVALWTEPHQMRSLARAGGWTGEEPATVSGAVTVTVSEQTQIVEFSGFAGRSPVAQPLQEGRVLLIERGARWRPEDPDLNASIYGADGALELTACVGDGIEHVLATRSGAVWIGYHDMGIFGNNGWGKSDSPRPVGASGLLRFAPDLTPDWEFPGPSVSIAKHPGLDISDCEALTIVGDNVWAYIYLEYPVVCINGDEVRSWSPAKPNRRSTLGVQALATDGRQVALAGGGSAGDAGRVVLVDLEQDRWVTRLEGRLVLPDGSRLDPKIRIQGLNDTLHVFAGQDWYQITLGEL